MKLAKPFIISFSIISLIYILSGDYFGPIRYIGAILNSTSQVVIVIIKAMQVNGYNIPASVITSAITWKVVGSFYESINLPKGRISSIVGKTFHYIVVAILGVLVGFVFNPIMNYLLGF